MLGKYMKINAATSNMSRKSTKINKKAFHAKLIIPNKYIYFKSFNQVYFTYNASIYFIFLMVKA